ncbi:hypothetical protein [Merismopedia glauca]|nr:hypothetical protein [Merismopedia glauca]
MNPNQRSENKFTYGVIQNQRTSLYQVWYKFNSEQIYFLTAHKNHEDAYDTMYRLTLVHHNSKRITCPEDLLKIADSFPTDEPPSPVSEEHLQALKEFSI